ncbi:MAG TPA: Calx-beta domain-containing protein [Thermoanaerobaculia bacterium]
MALALAATPAAAATFTVTTLNDTGAGSLRQAVDAANAASGADVITFHAAVTGTITLADTLYVTESIDVQGPGSGVLTLAGPGYLGIFNFSPYQAGQTYAVSGLRLTDGGIASTGGNLTLNDVTISGSVVGGAGGGVWFEGPQLTILNSTIKDNLAENGEVGTICGGLGFEIDGGNGGGVYVQQALSVTLNNVTVSGNGARYHGGGVAILLHEDPSTVSIANSRFTGNTAGLSAECMPGSGGGLIIFGFNNNDTVTITDSEFSGNTAGGASGGGFTIVDLDTVTIARSTISGNQATGTEGGGGICLGAENGLLEQVTISGNTAAGPGGALLTQPPSIAPPTNLTIRHSTISGNAGVTNGGIKALDAATITIAGSIVANSINTATSTSGDDLANDATSSFAISYSNIEQSGAATITDGGGNVFSADPQLGPLQNNGGSTLTHLPADSSPVIDAGDPAFTAPPATDQRGLPRLSGGRIDLGAVEVALANTGTLSLSAATYSVAENGGSVTITVNRTGSTTGEVSVDYATSSGSAQTPSDYTAASGTLTWANGDGAAKTFAIPIVDDTIFEGAETVTITLTGFTGGASVGTSSATLTITENETFPVLTVSSVSQAEGHTGTSTAFQFSVTLSPASASVVTVNFSTAAGTATAADFSAAAGPLSFAAGVTSQVVNISVLGDNAGEFDETFTVVLSSPVNATAGSAGTGTIVNDDPPPTPIGVVANALSTTAITINWLAVPGATTYQIERQTSAAGAFTLVGTAATHSFINTGLTAATAYRYRVRAMNAFGVSAFSAPDVGTTVVFADAVLTGVKVKATHLAELRAATNALRTFAGLAAATFTGAATTGTAVQAVHITELRTAVDAARSAMSLSTGGYTDASLAGTRIKATHFQELRNRL